MNSLIQRLLFFWVVIFGQATAFAQFEGTLDLKIITHEGGSATEMVSTMYVKEKMLAAEMKGEPSRGGGRFIFRGDKQLMWIVNDAEKMYLELTLNDREKAARGTPQVDASTEQSGTTVRKTGKSKTILGYVCQEYVVSDSEETTTIWGTQKLGTIYESLTLAFGKVGAQSMSGNMRGWERELIKLKLFPLKIITMKEAVVSEEQEVINIRHQKVISSIFEPPADYTKQSFDEQMQKMLQELQQQMQEQKKEN